MLWRNVINLNPNCSFQYYQWCHQPLSFLHYIIHLSLNISTWILSSIVLIATNVLTDCRQLFPVYLLWFLETDTVSIGSDGSMDASAIHNECVCIYTSYSMCIFKSSELCGVHGYEEEKYKCISFSYVMEQKKLGLTSLRFYNWLLIVFYGLSCKNIRTTSLKRHFNTSRLFFNITNTCYLTISLIAVSNLGRWIKYWLLKYYSKV